MMQSEAMQKTMITKENAYPILKAFAKEYRKQHKGHDPIEIVIVGGGSILLNYDFRDCTQDFDVLTQPMDGIKSVVYEIAERYNLRDDWMNTDFVHTRSYSNKLREVSKYYCSFNNGSIEIRTVDAEYLIAMKMISAREYRNDMSDVIGILSGIKKKNHDLDMSRIDFAIRCLYGEPKDVIKDEIYQKVQKFVCLTLDELQKEYALMNQDENKLSQILVSVNQDSPGVVTEESIDNIIDILRKRKNNNPS